MDDLDVIRQYLDNASMHEEASNEFGYGYWLGRALEHADQNAVDVSWLVAEVESRGLDAALVGVPKLDVHRG